MAATDEKGRQWSYLASDEKYQAVRDLQLRNLVVPVTGCRNDGSEKDRGIP
jgi:hypothetical protein